MNAKESLKPSALKILIFLLIGAIYLYFAKEDACAVSFYFAFCYKAYGFPFQYMVTGNIESASSQIKTLPFADYFSKSGNFLLNPVALILNLILIYLLACLISVLFGKMKVERRIAK